MFILQTVKQDNKIVCHVKHKILHIGDAPIIILQVC